MAQQHLCLLFKAPLWIRNTWRLHRWFLLRFQLLMLTGIRPHRSKKIWARWQEFPLGVHPTPKLDSMGDLWKHREVGPHRPINITCTGRVHLRISTIIMEAIDVTAHSVSQKRAEVSLGRFPYKRGGKGKSEQTHWCPVLFLDNTHQWRWPDRLWCLPKCRRRR